MTEAADTATWTSIPKDLAPRSAAAAEQCVPRILWQTMKRNRVPSVMARWAESWIERNPEYRYRFFDDDDIHDWIAEEFPDYLEAYDLLEFGASKADLWRYLLIYRHGGIYVDLDCECVVALRHWIDPKASFVSQLGSNRDLCQWMLISAPGNPILLGAAERARERILSGDRVVRYRGFELVEDELVLADGELQVNDAIKGVTGPAVLQEAAEAYYLEPDSARVLDDTQIVCVSKTRSCQMGGNVAHHFRDKEYLAGLAMLRTPHYSRRQLFLARIRKLLRKLGIWPRDPEIESE